jgi:peptide deformylase
MKMPIVTVPHASLTLPSAEVPSGHSITQLVQDMVDTATHHGAEGLAAVQIGAALRIIIVNVNEGEPRQYVCLINPKISKLSGILISKNEGCLSIPGKSLAVPRALTCEVDYHAYPNGKFNNQKLQGRLARIVQHEIDHLDGILMTDRAVTLQ